jgi:hypothetical protein
MPAKVARNSLSMCFGLHRFDIPAFYREASRVLRPGGTLAVWGYALNTFDGEPAATQALRVLHGDRLGPYWDPKRRLLDEEYRGASCQR